MNLYNMIVKNMDGTEHELDKNVCSIITKLPENNIEDIYLLILHHAYIKKDYKKEAMMYGKELPYGGKFIDKKKGKGLNYKPSNIPLQLQKIIHRYIKYVIV